MIIHNLPSEIKNIIPSEFKKNVLDKMDINFTPVSFDKNKTLDEQNISEDAKKILASIYINYLATDDERKQLIFEEKKSLKEKEEEKKEYIAQMYLRKTKFKRYYTVKMVKRV